MSLRPSRLRNRIAFVVILTITLLTVYAFRATGPLTIDEQIIANEGY